MKIIKLFDTLLKFGNGNIYVKNQMIFDLHVYYQVLKSNPRVVFLPPLSLRISKEKISSLFELLRTFQTIDKLTIETCHFNQLHLFYNFDNFHFTRSFENVREFICTSTPNKFLMAVLCGRSLQVYDYILNKLIFKVNLSN